jgi:sporulation protein YlmC with PRC-barrel domain
MRLELGITVHCSDGVFGELADVVIDPTSRHVTHLVVEPHHQHGLARLVPVELAEAAGEEQPAIALRSTIEGVRRLAPVQEFAYLRLGEFPASDPDWDVGVQDVLAMPYYGGPGPGIGGGYAGGFDEHVGVSYDRVPKGEVEIRRASAVVSADGHRLGHVDGLLVDSEDQITHVVLEHGHLWGRREVTIPIGAVAKVKNDAVTLSLSKDEVEALEPVPVHRWQR